MASLKSMQNNKHILLHICCGPCGIYPLEKLRQGGYEVSGFFYNPNIHPADELKRRKAAVADFGRIYDIEVIFPEYRESDFFEAIKGKEEKPDRCLLCWGRRIKETAGFAKKSGFGFFTTTLLVSPYQDQEALKKIGYDAACSAGVKFYYEDFRPGFRKAHTEAKAKGMYCQKYCGCKFSLTDLARCKK